MKEREAYVRTSRADLRVAFVMSSAGVGGTEAQAALLVRNLLAQGVDVEVVLLSSDLQMQDFAGARQHVLGTRSVLPGPFALLTKATRLRRVLRRGDFSLVHSAMAEASVLTSLLAPRSLPVVSWRRNMGNASTSGRLRARVERWAASRADYLVGNSDGVRDFWTSQGQVPRVAWRTIPNAIEDWRFERTAPAQVDIATEHVLLSVGNLRSVKRHEDLVEAARLLRLDGHDVGVVVVGDGPRREQLLQLAESARVPLSLPGVATDTRAYLAAADVYVHPSEKEGASNAVGEALAQGVPVVSTAVGDAATLLDGVGSCVPVGRPDLLAASIASYLRAPQRAGAAPRVARAAERTVERMVGQHLQIYGDLCGVDAETASRVGPAR